MYPEYAEIKGKKYKIDTDFRTALNCFEIIEDDSITDYERALAVIYLLFNFIPEDEDIPLFLEKVKIYLECGKDSKNKNNKKDMDFEQDKNYITASFMSDYHIDLTKEKMHFWLYISLIEGLTDNSILNRVRDLRNTNLSEIKDPKEREKVKKAKKSVELKKKEKKLSQEQIDNINEFMKLANIKKER